MSIVINGTNGITWPSGDTQDDYKEGTFTPSISGTPTYGALRNGFYTKIGNIVSCSLVVNWTALTHAATSFQISGLPYSVFTSASYRVVAAPGYLSGVDYAGNSQVAFLPTQGSATIEVYSNADNSTPINILGSNMSSSGEISLSLVYQIS